MTQLLKDYQQWAKLDIAETIYPENTLDPSIS